jgi:hypothetical protein
MTNWRQILSWRTKEWIVGASVRTIVDSGKRVGGVVIPAGTIGTVVGLPTDTNDAIILLDWGFPTPNHAAPEGRDDGWCLRKNTLELI